MGNISDKIEQIRKKPEHIRIRYVWGCVAASMVLIVVIWFFSIAAMLKKEMPQNDGDSLNELKTQLSNINQQAPSLKDIGNQLPATGSQNEGVNNTTDKTAEGDFQYPVSSQQDETPKSSAYSTE